MSETRVPTFAELRKLGKRKNIWVGFRWWLKDRIHLELWRGMTLFASFYGPSKPDVLRMAKVSLSSLPDARKGAK